MKKIGILTFHRAHNYGAMLQAYASQVYLQKMGYDVEIIDYHPVYIKKPFKLFDTSHYCEGDVISRVKTLVARVITFRRRYIRYMKFNKFMHNYLNLSKEKYDNVHRTCIAPLYDIYYIGSDQVWSSKITKGYDSLLWGNIICKKGEAKVISYAASMERVDLQTVEQSYCKNKLMNFDRISVRERHLKKILQPLTNKQITVACDPTFLLSKDDYNLITKTVRVRQKYILIYQMGINPLVYEIANQMAQQKGWIVKEITSACPLYHNRSLVDTCSPSEFIGLIRNAEFIVTTSFHGTAFSVILEKQFYTVVYKGLETRMLNLLTQLGISDRFIYSQDDITKCKSIDYEQVRVKKDIMVRQSELYIKECMQL